MPFRIVIDTSEQQPYSFECDTVRRKLVSGDYSVDGMEGTLTVERKSLTDFAKSCAINDHRRFGAELARMRKMRHAIIVVEASMDTLLRNKYTLKWSANDLHKLIGWSVHIQAKFGVPVFWPGSREAAVVFVEKYLRFCWKNWMVPVQAMGS